MKSFLLKLVCLLCLPVLVSVANFWINPNRPLWNLEQLAEGEVDLSLLAGWEEPFIWVDARSPEAFEDGHIPEAINIYGGAFDEMVIALFDRWEPGVPIVVYCDSRQCGASEELAQRFRNDMQIENVYVLKGGWQSWLESKS